MEAEEGDLSILGVFGANGSDENVGHRRGCDGDDDERELHRAPRIEREGVLERGDQTALPKPKIRGRGGVGDA